MCSGQTVDIHIFHLDEKASVIGGFGDKRLVNLVDPFKIVYLELMSNDNRFLLKMNSEILFALNRFFYYDKNSCFFGFFQL